MIIYKCRQIIKLTGGNNMKSLLIVIGFILFEVAIVDDITIRIMSAIFFIGIISLWIKFDKSLGEF